MSSEKWKRVVVAEQAFYQARQDYVREALSNTDIRDALSDPRERGTALRLLLTLESSYSENFSTELVGLASVGHCDVALAREAIERFYRPQLMAEVERTVNEVVAQAQSDEEYRRVAELYEHLGSTDALARHLEKCRHHPSPDVQEVAEDFARERGHE